MVFKRFLNYMLIPKSYRTPDPNRLLEYDLENDLTHLHLISFHLPSIEPVKSRTIINLIFDIFCWINAIKVAWFYWLDIPTAIRFGDLSLFYGESRYYGLAYGVIGFVYINVAYNVAHWDPSHVKSYYWLRNYNEPFPDHHYFVQHPVKARWAVIKKRVNRVYLFLWFVTRCVIIPSATFVALSPIFMSKQASDLITNVPSAILTLYACFYAFNLVRMSVFLAISYGFIMHYSLELNLKYLRNLKTKKTVNYSQLRTFFQHYLNIYNEAFEANKFMSKLSGVLYSGTFLESLVCIYVAFIAPESPVSTRMLFLGFFNLHLTLNIILMSLAFIYLQRLDQLVRNNIHKLLTRSIIKPALKIKLEEALFMMESYPMGFRCFHFFRFNSSSLLLTLLELGAHMLLIVMSVPRVTH
uniref:Uncharacterized protein n=2 Tax=Tetranychus urticae TaxID=32264 RepID=T1KQE7_TETUR